MPPVQDPWPWYVAGPLIGLLVPALLVFGGKVFGLSANLRHACAALPVPASSKPRFFQYDWRSAGTWNLVFAAGIAVGGLIGIRVLSDPSAPMALSASTVAALADLGVTDVTGFVPTQLISWAALATPIGALMVIGGGFQGLSAALHLAEAGTDVVLLEAKEPGFGASGRNGGQLGSGQRVDQLSLEAMIGREDARKYWDLGEEAKDLVRDLIARHGIDCHLRDGVAWCGSRPGEVAHLHEYADHMAEHYGYEIVWECPLPV